MDCQLTRTLISLGRRELSVADADALEGHLVACPACSSFAQRSNSFDASVARAMVAVQVPDGLRASLLQDAYARRGQALRRTLYQWSALAATILVAIGLAFGGYWKSRPSLDTNDLAGRTAEEWSRRQEAVENWLTDQSLPARLPYDFNYSHYVFHGTAQLARRGVPVVVFANGQDTARVYIVRKSQFQTDKAALAHSSPCTVEVFSDLHPDVVYVVVFTSDSIRPFLKPQSGPVA